MKGTVVEYHVSTKSKRWNRFFGVPSNSNPNREPYKVSVWDNGNNSFVNWACSCPRWTLNASRPECSHIKRMKHELAFGYVSYYATAPESLAKFIKRFDNAFEAVEIAEEKKVKPRKQKPGAITSSSLIELD